MSLRLDSTQRCAALLLSFCAFATTSAQTWSFDPIDPANPLGTGPDAIDFAATPDGRPALAWMSSTGVLRYAERSAAGVWQLRTLDASAGAPSLPVSVAIPADGRPLVAYQAKDPFAGGVVGPIKLARRNATGPLWQFSTIDPRVDGATTLALAILPDQTPALLYQNLDIFYGTQNAGSWEFIVVEPATQGAGELLCDLGLDAAGVPVALYEASRCVGRCNQGRVALVDPGAGGSAPFADDFFSAISTRLLVLPGGELAFVAGIMGTSARYVEHTPDGWVAQNITGSYGRAAAVVLPDGDVGVASVEAGALRFTTRDADGFVPVSIANSVSDAVAMLALPSGEVLIGFGGSNGLTVASAMRTVPTPGDLTGDGQVDLADLGLLFSCWGQPCGDVTGDGTTDLADLGIVFAAWTA